MDIKFILILAVVVIVAVLLHDFNSFKKFVTKKLNDIENKFNTNNQEFTNIVKREILTSNNKFKTYTSEMIQEIRKMNKIENQMVTLISDGFDDGDTIGSIKHIPYLSDSNNINICGSPKKNNKTSEKVSMYMSDTDNEDMFIIKDNNDDILNSARINTEQKINNRVGTESKLSDNNNNNLLIESCISENNTSSHTKKSNNNISIHSKSNSGSGSGSGSVHSKSTSKLKSKLENHNTDNKHYDENINDLKILQKNMETNDDLTSQDITIGSTKDKIKTDINISSNNIVDDLSLGTTDDNTFKLYSIGRYTKADLLQIAKRHNIDIPDKINKDDLYMTLKNSIN